MLVYFGGKELPMKSQSMKTVEAGVRVGIVPLRLFSNFTSSIILLLSSDIPRDIILLVSL